MTATKNPKPFMILLMLIAYLFVTNNYCNADELHLKDNSKKKVTIEYYNVADLTAKDFVCMVDGQIKNGWEVASIDAKFKAYRTTNYAEVILYMLEVEGKTTFESWSLLAPVDENCNYYRVYTKHKQFIIIMENATMYCCVLKK